MDDPTPPPSPGATPPQSTMPEYRGAPLDAERGPGLGCFWTQVVLIVVFFVLKPFGVLNGWPDWLNAVLLFVTLGLLLFAGQTAIFLLRLVAADRRTRRRPLRSATPTVGEIEDAADPEDRADDPGGASGRESGPPVVRQ